VELVSYLNSWPILKPHSKGIHDKDQRKRWDVWLKKQEVKYLVTKSLKVTFTTVENKNKICYFKGILKDYLKICYLNREL
jgi:hypothetical protein